MSSIPENLSYAPSHEWLLIDGSTGTVGISDHAQEELTDIVFVELPEVGKVIEAGESCAVVESVKTASDIYSPIEGEIIEVNEALESDPGLVNSSPYENGWFFKLKISDQSKKVELLDPPAYKDQIGES